MDEIIIVFEGIEYRISAKVYDEREPLVRLPDGRLIMILSWYEIFPPRPNKVVEVEVWKAEEVIF